MENIAIAKNNNVRVSTRKVRVVADSIRKMSVDKALGILATLGKRGAYSLDKTLKSAVANAVSKGMAKDKLMIKTLEVNEGPFLKRFRPSTRGRVHPYKKRTSKVTIILEEKN